MHTELISQYVNGAYASTLDGVQKPQEGMLNIYNWSKLTYVPEYADLVCLLSWPEQSVFMCVLVPYKRTRAGTHLDVSNTQAHVMVQANLAKASVLCLLILHQIYI